MRVLIAVDGSEGSFQAIQFAAKLLDPLRDQISFFYRPAEIIVRGAASSDVVVHERVRMSLADAIFQESQEKLPEGFRGKVDTHIGKQTPAQGTIAAAEKWQADLIVVGARGLGAAKRMLLGSVSRKVVETSEIPVLVVRTGPVQTSYPPRVLLCYDQAVGERQCELATRFNWPAGTVGHVIRVVEPMNIGHLPPWYRNFDRTPEIAAMAKVWTDEHEQEVQAVRAELNAFVAKTCAPFQGQAPIVAEGNPAEQLLHTIEAEKVDLAIVGKSAGGAMKRMFVGSTSFAVLNQAHCSVLVIPVK